MIIAADIIFGLIREQLLFGTFVIVKSLQYVVDCTTDYVPFEFIINAIKLENVRHLNCCRRIMLQPKS